MNNNYLPDHITALYASMNKNLEAYEKNKKQQQIHNLRVSIKTLRAIFSFVNKMNGAQQLPKKVFKQLFSEAGALRELHINIKLLKKLSKSQQLDIELKNKEEVLSEAFNKKISVYKSMIEQVITETVITPHSYKIKEVKKYFKDQVKKSVQLLGRIENKNDVHQFRMKIKKMMYIYQTLPQKLQKQIGLNDTYINALQKKAGDWHDTFAAINFFKSLPASSEVLVNRLIEKEHIQFVQLMKKINNFNANIFC